MLTGPFCSPADHQQPRDSKLLSYLCEPVIKIICLFKNTDIITANRDIITGRKAVLESATGGRWIPRAWLCWSCRSRALEVALHQEMVELRADTVLVVSPKRKAEIVSFAPA